MKTTATTVRNVFCFLSLLALSVVLAACGGGGTDTSSNPSGTATVNVSLAVAPAFPAGTSFTATPTAVETAANPVAPGFDNVWVKIEKVALLPAKEGEGPDPNGEVIATGDGPGHEGAVFSGPVDQTINLLDLPSGKKIARFLNEFDDVPAGTYGKIRVYYSELWGQKEGDPERIDFHPTANSHFDVHFVNGDLVIPVAPDEDRGIRLYDVTINFVGLKIVENKNKVLMRPQVFATVEDVQYVVSGIADNVDKTLGTFDVSTDGGRSFHSMFSFDSNVTKWAFKDNETKQQVSIDNNLLGIAALRDGSLVDVYGMFTAVDTISADKVLIIFTDAISGSVAPGDEPPPSGWLNNDTFELSFPGDNVVIPMPSRTEARYDNNANLAQTFMDNVITEGASVRARGYSVTGVGVDAFWISVGP